MSIPVLYGDEYLIAVNKPAGLLSVPGRGPSKADCAVSRAAAEFGWIREVHRLDQATSGILLLARDAQTHRLMSQQFAHRLIIKTYQALCNALPADPQLPGVSCVSGRITVFQRLDMENRPRQMVDPLQGKESITEWALMDGIEHGEQLRGPEASRKRESPKVHAPEAENGWSSTAAAHPGRMYRLLISPRTGRTHQIRLALSVCGAPIVGDSLYGGSAEHSLPGLMLHASRLVFEHPRGGQKVIIESEPPF